MSKTNAKLSSLQKIAIDIKKKLREVSEETCDPTISDPNDPLACPPQVHKLNMLLAKIISLTNKE